MDGLKIILNYKYLWLHILVSVKKIFILLKKTSQEIFIKPEKVMVKKKKTCVTRRAMRNKKKEFLYL